MVETVLVTGASGFVAQHCIVQLLQGGYRVRGTLRSAKREDEVRAAIRNGGAEDGGLSLVEADLTKDEGWDEAVAGCAFVLHVASPFPAVQPEDEDELIRPARDGALRVLAAAAKAGVKRTVMTSSIAAVSAGLDKSGGRVFDESDWSDLDGENVSAYEKSKTIAERAAWEFMDTEAAGDMQLTVINPGAILGPILTRDTSTSVEIVRQLMIRAMPACPRIGFPVVDVRDVASAHIAAMTAPQAAGRRYICTLPQVWFTEVGKILDARFGPEGWNIPTGQLPDWVLRVMSIFNPMLRTVTPALGVERRYDNSRIRAELNWTAHKVPEMVIASAESLIEHGVVRRR